MVARIGQVAEAVAHVDVPAAAVVRSGRITRRHVSAAPVVGGVVRLVQGGRGHLVGLLVVGDGGPDGVGRGPGDVVGQLVQVVANLGHRVGVRSGDPVEHAAVAELGLVADVQHAEARAALQPVKLGGQPR